MLVSIITPIHNSEEFLSDCLTSIQQQAYSKFECICIDDGSTDSSVEIVNKYRRLDGRFKVVKTARQGVSCARNIGLDQANGDAICFIDSDDFVHPQFLQSMVSQITATDSDVAICHYQKISISTTYSDYQFEEAQTLNSHVLESPFLELLKRPEKIGVVVWNKLYRASLLAGKRFQENLQNGEDNLFVFQLMKEEPKVSVSDQRLLFYRLSKESLSKTYDYASRENFAKHWVAFAEDCKDLPPKMNELLVKRTTRILYRELIKRPARYYGLEGKPILEENRSYLMTLKETGLVSLKRLPLQDTIIYCLILGKAFNTAIILLLTSDKSSRRAFLAQRPYSIEE